jgi:hypothetical protein
MELNETYDAQLVGTKGIPVFVKTLVQDKADVEIIKATLDALNVLCTADSSGQNVSNFD